MRPKRAAERVALFRIPQRGSHWQGNVIEKKSLYSVYCHDETMLLRRALFWSCCRLRRCGILLVASARRSNLRDLFAGLRPQHRGGERAAVVHGPTRTARKSPDLRCSPQIRRRIIGHSAEYIGRLCTWATFWERNSVTAWKLREQLQCTILIYALS